jgi:predicted transglutaminase-like cysteine proteinase
MSIKQSMAIGITDVYKKIADMQDEAAVNNHTRVFAAHILEKDNDEKSFDRSCHNAEKIYLYVRDNIKFIDDIENVETLQYPERTIKNGFGDCDDMVILMGALYRSIGYSIALVLIKMNGNADYNHIYIAVLTDEGWKMCDAANKEGIFNWEISKDDYVKRKIVFIGTPETVTDGTDYQMMINEKTVCEYYTPGSNNFWFWGTLIAAGTVITYLLFR